LASASLKIAQEKYWIAHPGEYFVWQKPKTENGIINVIEKLSIIILEKKWISIR
jgi:hypothetical protein